MANWENIFEEMSSEEREQSMEMVRELLQFTEQWANKSRTVTQVLVSVLLGAAAIHINCFSTEPDQRREMVQRFQMEGPTLSEETELAERQSLRLARMLEALDAAETEEEEAGVEGNGS